MKLTISPRAIGPLIFAGLALVTAALVAALPDPALALQTTRVEAPAPASLT